MFQSGISTKAVKYVEPGRGPQLQSYAEVVSNMYPERKKYFEDIKKFYMGGRRTYRGELPERTLYDALQIHFLNGNESVAVFHGTDILKLNLDKYEQQGRRSYYFSLCCSYFFLDITIHDND